jgi:Ig-like domain from next to BRCA1 gene
MRSKDMKPRRLSTALAVLLAALLLVASAPARAETITGEFSYRDFGDNTLRPIFDSKVEIWRFKPGPLGSWEGSKEGEAWTDLAGRISVEMPWVTSGVVYALRVYASNGHVTVLGLQSTRPFYGETPRQTVSDPDEVLDFTHSFTDIETTGFFNLASAAWYAGEYVKRVYTDLPQAQVQVTGYPAFYEPATGTLQIDLDRAFDDGAILHEYGHFVHDQLGSLTLQPSSHDLCRVSDPEVAFMEGFADFFERAVLRTMPVPDDLSRDLEYDGSGQCGGGLPPDSTELFTAATLWDLVDPLGQYDPYYPSNESHDFVHDKDQEILSLLKNELAYSSLLRAPTIWDFRDAWRLRGYNELDLDRIYARHGLIPEFNLAECVSMEVPTTMVVGRTYPVRVRMRNTGSTVWEVGSQRLGSQNPEDNLTWGLNRVDYRVERGYEVFPGYEREFSFNVTAPATPGSYTFQWRMVQDGEGWFGDATPTAVVTVTSAESAQYVSQSVPDVMWAGASYAVSVTMRNNGDTTWNPGTHFLGSQSPQDNFNWGLNRVALPAAVPPGGQVTFEFQVEAPELGWGRGAAFQWRMLQEGIGWFGDSTQLVSVQLIYESPPPCDFGCS